MDTNKKDIEKSLEMPKEIMGKTPESIKKTIESLAEAQQLAPCIFVGVKVAERWNPGKMVDEKTFKAAVDRFLSNPAKGGKKNVLTRN